MFFSCKITNSALLFLDRNGIDPEELLALLDTPVEFLRDPSYWLDAKQTELLLDATETLVAKSEKFNFKDRFHFIEKLGHNCVELKAWGVLDGVLRMMQKPQDIYAQPDRFLSYFISPAPPIGNLLRDENGVSFDIPLSTEEYPLITLYLKSVFEALPNYLHQPLAQVNWLGNHLEINWQKKQADIFSVDNDPGTVINPQLTQNLVLSLEKSQKDLEEKNKELLLKNKELEDARIAVENQLREQLQSLRQLETRQEGQDLFDRLQKPTIDVHRQVMRLQDYLARAQQLIILLIGQGRRDKQVQEAMRRVDWKYVEKEFPIVAKETVQSLEDLRKSVAQYKPKPTSSVKLQQRTEQNFSFDL